MTAILIYGKLIILNTGGGAMNKIFNNYFSKATNFIKQIISPVKKHSFARRLTVVLIVAFFLPTLCMIIFYTHELLDITKKDIVNAHEQEINVIVRRYDDFISVKKHNFEFLNTYNPLLNIIETTDSSTIDKNVDDLYSLNEILSAMFSSEHSNELKVYHENEKIYNPKIFCSLDILKDKTIYKLIKKMQKTDCFLCIENDYGIKVASYRKYNRINKNEVILKISETYSSFRRNLGLDEKNKMVLYWIPPGGKCYLLKENEPKVVNPPNDFGLYTVKNTADDGSIFIALFEKTEYQIPQKKIIGLSIFVIFIIAFLLFVVIIIMVGLLTKRLSKIVDMINYEELNNKPYNNLKISKYYDEFDIISEKLIEYAETLNEKANDNLKKQKKLNDLEIMLLQERISPHFLYNTLSSIKWAYNDKKLSDLVDSMVKYYRIMLNGGSSLIELKNEFVGIQEYFKIQMFAYEKKFDVLIECPKELGNIKILKNILQPIAENAFIHGINCYDGYDGFVKINALKEKNYIKIVVENNGVLIKSEIIKNIFDDKDYIEKSIRGGYALKNIIKRIKLYYGDGSDLSIESGKTTKIILKLPIKNDEM